MSRLRRWLRRWKLITTIISIVLGGLALARHCDETRIAVLRVMQSTDTPRAEATGRAGGRDPGEDVATAEDKERRARLYRTVDQLNKTVTRIHDGLCGAYQDETRRECDQPPDGVGSFAGGVDWRRRLRDSNLRDQLAEAHNAVEEVKRVARREVSSHPCALDDDPLGATWRYVSEGPRSLRPEYGEFSQILEELDRLGNALGHCLDVFFPDQSSRPDPEALVEAARRATDAAKQKAAKTEAERTSERKEREMVTAAAAQQCKRLYGLCAVIMGVVEGCQRLELIR